MDENIKEEFDAKYYELKKKHVNDKSKLIWAFVGVFILGTILFLIFALPFLLVSQSF